MTIGSVSVLIPHYGDEAPTEHLIAQLRAQTPSAVTEIIVVDDCSPAPFPDAEDARVIRRATNGGFGAAVNTGAAAATGTHLLVLNSDLDIDPSFVADLCAAATPWQPAVCGPMLVDPSGRNQWSGRHFPRTRHYVIEWLTPLARFRDHRALHEAVGHDTVCTPGTITPVDWVVGAALLVPRETFLDAGGFDEGYFMNCEEVDLQRRLRAIGIPSVFIGTVTATHVGGGSSDSTTRRRWVTQARLRYARKWREGPGRVRAALRVASVANLVFNGARRLFGRSIAPWATFREELGYLSGGSRA